MNLNFWTRTANLAALSIVLWAPAVFALNSAEIEKMLKSEKIVASTAQIKSVVQGNEVHISTVPEKNSGDPTDRYKINAVLMAKTVMAADKNIQRFFVRFYDKNELDQYAEVTVRSVDIKAFASGVTSEKELLASLEYEKGSDTAPFGISSQTTEARPAAAAAPEAVTVAEGPLKDERVKLYLRIQNLKTKGVGVKPFLAQFNTLETMAGSADPDTMEEKVEALSHSVKDQENALAQRAKIAASPPPVRAAAAPAPVAPPVITGTPAPPAPSDSGGTALGKVLEIVLSTKMGIEPGLMPVSGPYFHPRLCIGTVIWDRKRTGTVNSNTIRMYEECQRMASLNRPEDVKYKLVTLSQMLGVPDPITNGAWFHDHYGKLWGGGHGHHGEHGDN